MFEARKKLDTKAGAGVQLNGGLAALGKINGKVQRAVIDAGLPVSQIKSRSKPWSGSKPFEELLHLDLGEIVKNAGGEISQNLIQDGELLWSAIMTRVFAGYPMENASTCHPTQSPVQQSFD